MLYSRVVTKCGQFDHTSIVYCPFPEYLLQHMYRLSLCVQTACRHLSEATYLPIPICRPYQFVCCSLVIFNLHWSPSLCLRYFILLKCANTRPNLSKVPNYIDNDFWCDEFILWVVQISPIKSQFSSSSGKLSHFTRQLFMWHESPLNNPCGHPLNRSLYHINTESYLNYTSPRHFHDLISFYSLSRAWLYQQVNTNAFHK